VSKVSPVVSGRSFAEVVRRPKSLEPELKAVPATLVEETNTFRGPAQVHNQIRPEIPPSKLDVQKGELRVTAVAGGGVGDEPAKNLFQAKEKGVMGNGKMASALPKALQDPGKSGMEAPIGGWLSDGNGLAYLDEDFNLQVLKTYLSGIRGELISGLNRIEKVIHLLEMKESVGCGGKAESLGLGHNSSRANQQMGGWSKPKKRWNKIQSGLLGPKPNKKSGQPSQGPGHTSSLSYRLLPRNQAQKLSQAGESSAMGAARATGDSGSTIAGDFSGELSSGAGIPKPVIMVSLKEAEKDGATNGGVGLGDEVMTQRLDTSTEEAETLGYAISTPKKSSKLPGAPTMLLPTISESDDGAQRSPMGRYGNSEDAQKSPMGRPDNSDGAQRLPAGGHGAKRGDRGLVSRPESSWVAGRTGFGPVCSGQAVESSDLVASQIAGSSDLAVIDAEVVSDRDRYIVCAEEACSGGMEKVTETYMQGGTEDQGVGQSNAENPFVENTLEKSMEVSDIAGLSWDGQEGRKEECLRRIVVDKSEIGRGGNTNNSDFQQAGHIMGRFWGNCSDDEA
jgi:hypothetical protein